MSLNCLNIYSYINLLTLVNYKSKEKSKYDDSFFYECKKNFKYLFLNIIPDEWNY